MMADSRILFKGSMKKVIRKNSKLKSYGINIDLLMIWLHIWSNLMVALSGLVKIMMVMYKAIVLLKVLNMEYLGYGSLGLMTSVLLAPDGSV